MSWVFRLSKLAQRLARLKAGVLCTLSACAGDVITGADALDPLRSNSPVATITVHPANASIAVGGAVQFTAVLKDSDSTVLQGRKVAWSSSATQIASVDETGMVTAKAPGTVQLTAAVQGKSATATAGVIAVSTVRAGHYASARGRSSGAGSIEDPWDLATALRGGGGRVRPGDTIWVRGGTHRGAFTSTVAGLGGAPVVVRNYPGERAIIDVAGTTGDGFVVRGAWSVFWGLELTNSDPARTTTSLSNNWRPNLLVNNASHTKYINLIIHDGGVAFFTYSSASDVEVYGCILYNNGWQSTNRGHGHALYVKSDAGPMVLRDNVMFNQFGWGVHAYTNAGSGKLVNIRVEGNVAFNNGTLSSNSVSPNILVGGADYATGDVVRDNLTYFPAGVGGTNVQVGYGPLANGEVIIRDNQLVGGDPVLRLGHWDRATVEGNVLFGTGQVISLADTTIARYTWAATRYYRDPLSRSWTYSGVSHPWLVWQALTGLGLSDVALGGKPGGPQVSVRPNLYEAGRATVVVYNWTRQSAVSVDLSAVLSRGDRYEVRNVQDPFGAPVIAGSYGGGAISLPLNGVTPPTPVGMASSRAPMTGPDFDVFLVTKT